jgi:hypothetical protein
MSTLTLKERIAAMEAWIASGTIVDDQELKRRQKNLDYLKKLADEPPKRCRLVSNSSSADLPLQSIIEERRGALATKAYALSVGINGHESRCRWIAARLDCR